MTCRSYTAFLGLLHFETVKRVFAEGSLLGGVIERRTFAWPKGQRIVVTLMAMLEE
jgi:hypothetical protein